MARTGRRLTLRVKVTDEMVRAAASELAGFSRENATLEEGALQMLAAAIAVMDSE